MTALCTQFDDRLFHVSQGHQAIMCGSLYVMARRFPENPCETNKLQGRTDHEQCFSMFSPPSSLRLEKTLVLCSQPDLLCFDRPKPQDVVESMHTLLAFLIEAPQSKTACQPTFLSDLTSFSLYALITRIGVIKSNANGAFGAVYDHGLPMRKGC